MYIFYLVTEKRMTEITETIYVNDKTMKWLKSEGRDLLINIADDIANDIISEGYFDIQIILENEGKCTNDNSICDNDCPKKVIIPKGKIQYIIDWKGFEEAHQILDFLEYVCKQEKIQKILNKETILKKGLLSLMGIKHKKDKKDTFLIANCGEGVDIKKYLADDEIPIIKKTRKK